MEEVRKNKLLSFDHPLKEIYGTNICQLNMRSWNLCIDNFLSLIFSLTEYIHHQAVYFVLQRLNLHLI